MVRPARKLWVVIGWAGKLRANEKHEKQLASHGGLDPQSIVS